MKLCSSFATADGKQAEETGYLKDVAINAEGEPIGTQVKIIYLL